MEAKDTVIKPGEQGLAIIKHPDLPMGQAIANEQAEITWKARDPEIEDAHTAGIQEVVDWITASNHSEDFIFSFDQAELGAKLKEWRANANSIGR